MVSLAWIKADNREFKVFVENRVWDIRKRVKPEKWKYCKSKENPADLITRFDIKLDNNEDLWWSGPALLKDQHAETLCQNNVSNAANELNFMNQSNVLNENVDSLKVDLNKEFNLEVKSDEVVILANTARELNNIGNVIDIKRFSDINKLFRVTGWILRFIFNLKRRLTKKSTTQENVLTSSEINI